MYGSQATAAFGPLAQDRKGLRGMQGIWLGGEPCCNHQPPYMLRNVRVSVHMGSCHTCNDIVVPSQECVDRCLKQVLQMGKSVADHILLPL